MFTNYEPIILYKQIRVLEHLVPILIVVTVLIRATTAKGTANKIRNVLDRLFVVPGTVYLSIRKKEAIGQKMLIAAQLAPVSSSQLNSFLHFNMYIHIEIIAIFWGFQGLHILCINLAISPFRQCT